MKNLKLKAARAAKDLSQEQLAQLCNVSRQTINAIEKGDYNPTINLCIAICRHWIGRWTSFFGTNEELSYIHSGTFCTPFFISSCTSSGFGGFSGRGNREIAMAEQALAKRTSSSSFMP